MAKHILIVAGDASGDRHAASLAAALKEKEPSLRVTSCGGGRLKAVSDLFLFPLVDIGGFGFWEPLMKLPQLRKALGEIRHLIRTAPPDAVVPVDYYGFNIHAARAARKAGIPVIYYISPQVWASRPGRVKKLAKVLEKMLVIFPFEEDIYRRAGIPVRFVGHPLIDSVPAPAEPEGLSIGLLPGSRRSIAARHLPIVIKASERLRSIFPGADFVLFRPNEIEPNFYAPFISGRPWIHLIHEEDYAVRKKLSLALSVSGTSALENMLLGIPMVVFYKLSTVTYMIARRLIRVPFVAIPNILAGRAIVPEFLQNSADPDKIASKARGILENKTIWDSTRSELLSLRNKLGGGNASRRAAEEILKILPQKTPFPSTGDLA
jgi:lipid-A-disaccharide synthase